MMMMRQQPVVDNFYWQPLPVLILAFVELASKKLQQQIKLRDCQTAGQKKDDDDEEEEDWDDDEED